MPKFDFPSYCLGDLSWVDIQEYLREKDTVLVPVASLEQHGRHLPPRTDTVTRPGFNRLIFVGGHGSNVKVIDPVLRKLKYETGAFVGYYKAYAEPYMGF